MKPNFSMLSTLSSALLSLEAAFLAVGGRWSEDTEPEAGLAGSTGTDSFLCLCSISHNGCSVQMNNVVILYKLLKLFIYLPSDSFLVYHQHITFHH